MEVFDIKCINIYLNDNKLFNERINIKNINIRKKVNNHNNLFLKFVFRKEDKYKFKSFNKSENLEVKVTVTEKNNLEKILFEGYAAKSNMTLDNHLLIMEVRGISFSKKIDIRKQNRIYQDVGLMYSRIIKNMVTQDINILVNKEDEKTGRLLIQYEETDWEFLKKLAYYMDTYILCEKKSVIFNKSSVKEYEEVSDYTIHSFGRNGDGKIEYIINSYNIYSIGDTVKLSEDGEEGKMLVVKADINLENQVLKGLYTLVKADKYEMNHIIRNNIAGIGIEAKVEEVMMSDNKGLETASVRVSFYENLDSKFNSGGKTDENQGTVLYPFPYIIPYSKDKTGLFITPEAGDNILVKFTNDNPEDGIVTGAVNNENGSRFSNPDYRNFFTGSSVELVIDGPKITMSSGSEIVKTSKEINLKGSEAVRVYSNNMKVK